jgi:hypothetical protein
VAAVAAGRVSSHMDDVTTRGSRRSRVSRAVAGQVQLPKPCSLAPNTTPNSSSSSSGMVIGGTVSRAVVLPLLAVTGSCTCAAKGSPVSGGVRSVPPAISNHSSSSSSRICVVKLSGAAAAAAVQAQKQHLAGGAGAAATAAAAVDPAEVRAAFVGQLRVVMADWCVGLEPGGASRGLGAGMGAVGHAGACKGGSASCGSVGSGVGGGGEQ